MQHLEIVVNILSVSLEKLGLKKSWRPKSKAI